MRIELVNPEELQHDLRMNISHLLQLTNSDDTKLQASILENGRLVGLAAYQAILGGEATRLVGMRVNMSHYMAGLGSVMMRAFAAEQAERETIIVGVQDRIDLSRMFEHACDGRVYPNYTSMFLRRDYDDLQGIAERTRQVLPPDINTSTSQIYAGRLLQKGFSITLTADVI